MLGAKRVQRREGVEVGWDEPEGEPLVFGYSVHTGVG